MRVRSNSFYYVVNGFVTSLALMAEQNYQVRGVLTCRGDGEVEDYMINLAKGEKQPPSKYRIF